MQTLIVDIFMISLLFMAIIFCWRLNVRLKHMRTMGEDLSPFMRNLSVYLGNISTTIDKLRQVAEIGDSSLNEKIPTAMALKEDFDILLEHSEKMAQRLDEVIDKARQMDRQLHHTLQLASGMQIKKQDDESAMPSSPSKDRTAYRSINQAPQATQTQDAYTRSSAQAEQHAKGPLRPYSTDTSIEPQQDRGLMSKLKGLR
jgi:hypothetical protein